MSNVILIDGVPVGYMPNDDKFTVLTGTTPADASDSVTIPYPTGFTNTNSVIISFQFKPSGNNWVLDGVSGINHLTTYTGDDGLVVSTEASTATGYRNKAFKAVLMRTDM